MCFLVTLTLLACVQNSVAPALTGLCLMIGLPVRKSNTQVLLVHIRGKKYISLLDK